MIPHATADVSNWLEGPGLKALPESRNSLTISPESGICLVSHLPCVGGAFEAA